MLLGEISEYRNSYAVTTDGNMRTASHGVLRRAAERVAGLAAAKTIAGGPPKMSAPPRPYALARVRLPRKDAANAATALTRHELRNASSRTGIGATHARGHTTPSPVDKYSARAEMATAMLRILITASTLHHLRSSDRSLDP